jgi:hypothetical protein
MVSCATLGAVTEPGGGHQHPWSTPSPVAEDVNTPMKPDPGEGSLPNVAPMPRSLSLPMPAVDGGRLSSAPQGQ